MGCSEMATSVVGRKRFAVLGFAQTWRPWPGNVPLYDITSAAHNECSVLRSFGMRLSPDEPGPATAPGNRLVFVRLP